MGFTRSLGFRAGLLSALILLVVLAIWHVATMSSAPVAAAAPALTPEQIEYARLMGKDPATLASPAAAPSAKSGFPTLAQMGAVVAKNLASPFYDNGPNDKGVGLQLGYSLGRVGLGYLLAALVAIPLGFVIGMSPLVYRALDPFIQVLKPISPLAWMPLALYTIKDSSISGIFVIFICSVWPMLINTAFGVASVRREWLNVAKTLEVTALRRAFARPGTTIPVCSVSAANRPSSERPLTTPSVLSSISVIVTDCFALARVVPMPIPLGVE